MIVVLVVVAAALVLAVAMAVRWLRAPLPQTRGRLRVTGLRADVAIVRDRRGLVNVDASSMEDAAFAMGFVHAQERLWQLDLTRRVACGRISEIAGRDGLTADRFLRRVGLRRIAEVEADRLQGEVRAMLEAYAAGVNAIVDSGRRLPIEFTLLRTRPERWSPVDSISCAKLLALGLSLNWDTELQRLRLLQAIGPDAAARLELVYPDANPTILADTARHAAPQAGATLQAMYREVADWLPSATGASNAWAVGPRRTTTGRALLCNDPHLEPSVPSIWLAAHVRVAADFETTGVTTAGQPFPLIGHNRRVAWGHTNSFVDSQDLVLEEFEDAAGTRHRTEEGWERSAIAREVIRVKDRPDEVEEVVLTRHGPVVERCDDAQGGRWMGLALQWTALTPANASRTVLELQRAGDWDAFRAAFDELDAPSQNAVYADVDGHIGYFCSGRVPVRREPPSGLPKPGWDGDQRWVRFLRRDEVPQVLDPPDGVVVTANNRITGSDFPHHIAGDYMSGYRARRILELLDAGQVDPGAMAAAQLDVVAPPAQLVGSLLRDIGCRDDTAERVRRQLVAWDGSMSPELIEPTVYEAFMLRLAERALRPLCGDAWVIAAGVDLEHAVFRYPGNLLGRTTPLLVESWANGDESLLDGQTTWAEAASVALEDAVADLQRTLGHQRRWAWGRVHRIRLCHPLAVRRPLRLLLNAPAITVGGSVDTIMATGHRPGLDFTTAVMAPSWRQVCDVGRWDDGCSGILYPGQSGHRASRNHHDLSKRWARNQQLPLRWGDDAFRGRRRLTLQPRERALARAPSAA